MIWAPEIEYEKARGRIQTLDLIAFEGRGAISSAIRAFTGGSVTHVGFAIWWHNRLMLAEFREGVGGRAVHLSDEIPPDGVLWCRMKGIQDAPGAVEYALSVLGAPYNYGGVLGFVQRALNPLRRGQDVLPGRGAQFCSQYVSAVARRAGVDLRPDLADSETSPDALARSSRLELLGRLR